MKIKFGKFSVGSSAEIQVQKINESSTLTEGAKVIKASKKLFAEGRVFDSWQKLDCRFMSKEGINTNDPEACQSAIQLGIDMLRTSEDPKMSLDQKLKIATTLLNWKNQANPNGVVQPRNPNGGSYGDILNAVHSIAKLAQSQNNDDLAAQAMELLTVHHYSFQDGAPVITEGTRVVEKVRNFLAQGRVYDSWQKLDCDFMSKEGINNNDPTACQSAIQLGIDILHSLSKLQPVSLDQKLKIATTLLNWKNQANPNGVVQPRNPNSGNYGDILNAVHSIAELAQKKNKDDLAAQAMELLTLHHYSFNS